MTYLVDDDAAAQRLEAIVNVLDDAWVLQTYDMVAWDGEGGRGAVDRAVATGGRAGLQRGIVVETLEQLVVVHDVFGER